MIEIEEEIIRTIEEIDNTFSSINRTLRNIRGSIESIGKNNRKISEGLSPWIRFFSVESSESEESELLTTENEPRLVEEPSFQNICVTEGSPISMKLSSPRNPFVDSTSSEMLNKTFLGDLSARFHTSNAENESSSFVKIVEEKAFESYEETESSDNIFPFNPGMLPPLFRNEEGLFLVYEIISRAPITLEEIYNEISTIPREKINIFVDLLLRKRFIGREGNTFRTA
ncbi:uncharacterized protein Eint_110270 [Encephalitozoon intestinalis ATCC 50506]|uniref:DASH complex subunit ASK1 n=1 Tax=Encephalitozoon intestinalis (strain ATCC 50506) TaxID=876142 RepID=E0SAA2_ENCIT|nr:uncharacterized protein Eint_110270 [Encephalitozoon intestinalis ATCC 50506]ADM12527.1 hypothetical protein Eint_110270 [Encephalitozoon intestinalis ATCC 50506]UTX46380.1 putative signal transducer and activator of transcription [Encephalitozoon intestinalis]